MMMPDIKKVIKHYPEFEGIHPACEAVPSIDAEAFNALVEDIKRNGLRVPLLRYKGLLLDGRTRLLACYEAQQEIRLEDEPDDMDPWDVVLRLNILRRQLSVGQKATYALALLDHLEAEAKKRMFDAPRSGNVALAGNGQARDQAAQQVSVSGRSVQKAKTVREERPDLLKEVKAGTLDLEIAYKKARAKRRASRKADKPAPVKQFVEAVTVDGRVAQLKEPDGVRFNSTNDSIDWAAWSWNPVTGCDHGCTFCYAREIAHSDRMAPFYPFQFAPTLHEYRLSAPANTPLPENHEGPRGRVFVCSMADLFGKWVPDEWIDKVFQACLAAPEWTYLFLTKYPARYRSIPLLPRGWYGTSVIQQSDVQRVEKAMQAFECKQGIKWVSLEPMLEPIRFTDLSWCDLLVIGSQTSTSQPTGFVPEFAPEFDWVVDVVEQCRKWGVPYYLKENLGIKQPGMKLAKMLPRGVTQ